MYYRINLSCIWSPTSISTLNRLLIGASGSVIILGKKWERSCLDLYVGDEGDLSCIHDECVPVGKHSCAYPSKPPNTHPSFLSNLKLFSTVWACVNTTTYQQASIRLCFPGAERTLFLVRPGFLSLSHEASSTHRKHRGLVSTKREGAQGSLQKLLEKRSWLNHTSLLL